jgi:hypothetical protein
MHGNERVRFCGECSLNVYNLSNMTKRDAEALILKTEGRLCVRYYHRSDGSILTSNCPVGLQAFKRRVSGISKAIASSVLSFFAGMAVLAGLQGAQNSLNSTTEVGIDLIDPVPLVEDETAPPPPAEMIAVMGTIAAVSQKQQRQMILNASRQHAEESCEASKDSFTLSGEF